MSELRGELFEKGGCNFSAVHGPSFPAAPPGAAPAAHGDDVRPPRPEELAGKPFFATGVSLVMHPRNPFVPVVHLNVRYLEAGDLAWFGGGTDLTPFRAFPEDTAHFHGVLQQPAERTGTRGSRNGRGSTSSCPTGIPNAEWAASSSTISADRSTGTSSSGWARPSCPPTSRWSNGAGERRGARRIGRRSSAGAGGMSSSTCSTTVARSSASRAGQCRGHLHEPAAAGGLVNDAWYNAPAMTDGPAPLASMIDHTLLKPGATHQDLVKLCDEARRYGFATVCVSSGNVALCARLLEGCGVRPIAVVGFPSGTAATADKVRETREAISAGAAEIDMVLHVGRLKAKDYGYVESDIREVVQAARPAQSR